MNNGILWFANLFFLFANAALLASNMPESAPLHIWVNVVGLAVSGFGVGCMAMRSKLGA